VSNFAAAVVRAADEWSAHEVSLGDAADIEDVADTLRDVNPSADVSLMFVESNDEYLVILRLDQGEDLRVFGSDVAFAEESRLGALLLGEVAQPPVELNAVDLEVPEPDGDDSDDADGPASPVPADAEPAGDADLLSDLGVPASRLLELCGQDGMLPSDITAEVCQAIGCGDEVEELRDT
jgi:putative tRNA adenosine deaminase-associated protein